LCGSVIITGDVQIIWDWATPIIIKKVPFCKKKKKIELNIYFIFKNMHHYIVLIDGKFVMKLGIFPEK